MFSSRSVFGFVLVAVLATAFVMAGLTVRVDEPMKIWFGTIGVLPFAAAMATVAMLFVAAAHNDKMLEQAQKTERASRFQKGAELIGSASRASRVAGCQVLVDVAADDPQNYQDTVVRTLRHLVSEHTRDFVNEIYALTPESPIEDIPDLPAADGVSGAAVGALCRIAAKDRWLGTSSEGGMLRFWGVYLNNSILGRADFTRFNFVRMVLVRSTWEDCKADRMEINARTRGYVIFRRCRFQDVELKIASLRGDIVPSTAVRFEDCLLTNVTLNGVLVS